MSEQNKPEERQPTPEEIAEMRKKRLKFYNEQIDLLKTEERYETLLTSIEELRTRRFMAVVRRLQMSQQHDPEPEESPKAPEPVEDIQREEGVPKEPVIRKLKVEKA